MAQYQNIKLQKPFKSSVHCITGFTEILEPLIWVQSHKCKSSRGEWVISLEMDSIVWWQIPLHVTLLGSKCLLTSIMTVPWMCLLQSYPGKTTKENHFDFKGVPKMLIAGVSAKTSGPSWQAHIPCHSTRDQPDKQASLDNIIRCHFKIKLHDLLDQKFLFISPLFFISIPFLVLPGLQQHRQIWNGFFSIPLSKTKVNENLCLATMQGKSYLYKKLHGRQHTKHNTAFAHHSGASLF